jgi:GPH family glycoside/pentoside/hexuronide:cation symporter
VQASASPPSDDGGPLPRGLLVLYGLPYAAYTAVSMPLRIWLLKFTSDELLLAPAAMGTAILVARLWDAVSDPMAGHWSDRTHSRFGRRRSWILLSSPLMAITLVMVWSPPASLQGLALLLWVAAGLILWETASTAFYVPYHALGLELTRDYHERTRLFVWRHMVTMLGYAASLGLLEVLRRAEAPRDTAFTTSLVSGLALALIVAGCTLGIHEPADHQGRGGVNIRSAFRDVLRNPHAPSSSTPWSSSASA